MGFLDKLFDPAGITTGNKGDWVNNFLDPAGGTLENWGIGAGSWNGQDLHQNIGNWMDNTADFNSSLAQDRWHDFARRPQQLMVSGGDPFSTRLANSVQGTDWKPMWDQWGLPNQQNYENAQAKGINTSDSQGMNLGAKAIANAVVDYYTFGLGGTALQAMDDYGNHRKVGGDLGKLATNVALNYVGGLGDAVGDAGQMSSAVDDASTASEAAKAASEMGTTASSASSVAPSLASTAGNVKNFNLGSSLGVDNAAGQGMINSLAGGAAKGALGSAVQGGNIGKGAEQGALYGGLTYGANNGGSMLGSMFGNGGGEDDSPGMYSIGNYGTNMGSIGGNDWSMPQPSYNGAFSGGNGASETPLGDGGYPESFNKTSPTSLSTPTQNFINAITGAKAGTPAAGSQGYGGIASNLLGLYQANQQRKAYQGQLGQLNNLFTPNSAYAQQMAQTLARKDAAGGRNSQYGPRAAQLAASLTQAQANLAPQQMAYQQAISRSQNQMANNGMQGLNRMFQQLPNMKQDWGSLMGMFNGGNQ